MGVGVGVFGWEALAGLPEELYFASTPGGGVSEFWEYTSFIASFKKLPSLNEIHH